MRDLLNVGRGETRVERHGMRDRAGEKRGAEQQHGGERDLHRQERDAKAVTRRAGERPVLAAANRGGPCDTQDWTEAGEGAGHHRHQHREEEHEGIRREVLGVPDLASAQSDEQGGHLGGEVQRDQAGNEERTRTSVMSWRATRDWLAPSDSLMAISSRRATVLARTRLPALAQASSITRRSARNIRDWAGSSRRTISLSAESGRVSASRNPGPPSRMRCGTGG